MSSWDWRIIDHNFFFDIIKFLNNSLISETQILEFDADGDGGVDQYEYLSRSLVLCKMAEQQEIDFIVTFYLIHQFFFFDIFGVVCLWLIR